MTDTILAMAAFGGVCGLVVLIFLLVGARPSADRQATGRGVATGPAEHATLGVGRRVPLGPRRKTDAPAKGESGPRAGRTPAGRLLSPARLGHVRRPAVLVPGAADPRRRGPGPWRALPMYDGIVYGIIVGLAGTVLPGYWISRRRRPGSGKSGGPCPTPWT